MDEAESLVEQIKAQLSLIAGLQANGNLEAQRWEAALAELAAIHRSGDHYAVLRDQELHRELSEIMRSRVSTTTEIERVSNQTRGLLSELRRTGRAADPSGLDKLARYVEAAVEEARDARAKAEDWLLKSPRVQTSDRNDARSFGRALPLLACRGE